MIEPPVEPKSSARQSVHEGPTRQRLSWREQVVRALFLGWLTLLAALGVAGVVSAVTADEAVCERSIRYGSCMAAPGIVFLGFVVALGGTLLFGALWEWRYRRDSSWLVRGGRTALRLLRAAERRVRGYRR